MARIRDSELCPFEKMRRGGRREQERRRFRRDKGWVVKSNRPEESVGDPNLYYTDREVEMYARSGGMKMAQERIALRILELLGLGPGSSLLDVGAGPGYTAEVYRSRGYNVTCLDLIPRMVEKARERGFEAYVGDMRQLEEVFSGRKFGGVVSASSLQWIKDEREIVRVAQGAYSVLDLGGPLVFQFYPKSENELYRVKHTFVRNGFHGEIVVDSPDIPKNRTVYLTMQRD